jgi:hypothetical protein
MDFLLFDRSQDLWEPMLGHCPASADLAARAANGIDAVPACWTLGGEDVGSVQLG